jgi:hypothetical protein
MTGVVIRLARDQDADEGIAQHILNRIVDAN